MARSGRAESKKGGTRKSKGALIVERKNSGTSSREEHRNRSRGVPSSLLEEMLEEMIGEEDLRHCTARDRGVRHGRART